MSTTLTLRPNADGSPLDLLCSTGSTHYVLVDEAVADDSDYVYYSGETPVGGRQIVRDVLSIPNHTTESGVIAKVTLYIRAKYEGSHYHVMAQLWDADQTKDMATSWSVEVTDSFTTYSHDFTTNEHTGVAWTWADIDEAMLHVCCYQGGAGAACKISQAYIVVDFTPPPVIDSFTATPENMEFGKSSLLAWETTDATTVTLNQNIGLVGVDGAKSVSPSETTSYTLTASNISGTVYDYVTVTVIPSSNKISMADIAGSFPNRGLLPQLGIGKSYLEYSSDITDTYVQSLGFSFTGGDFKRPYMAKDYQSMMYLFNDTPSDISNGVRETQLSKITGSLPDRNDAYFDFSQTLASEDNFNAYAAENYRLMGKITPTASMSFSGAVESIFSDVDTNIPSRNTANLSVVSPRFSGDKYIWTGRVKDGTGDWGSLSNSSGLTTTYYTPTLTANQRNVIITLSSGGKTLAELEFMVWFKG
jgi:hypothetical protein